MSKGPQFTDLLELQRKLLKEFRGTTKGDQGIQGISGIQGVSGPMGSQGSSGAAGAKGAPGSPGIPGSPGKSLEGPTGPPGTPGKDAPEVPYIVDARLDHADNHLIFEMSDGSEIDAGEFPVSDEDGLKVIRGGNGKKGDVVGPNGAQDNTVALFDGTTGKLLKDSAPSVVNISSTGINTGGGISAVIPSTTFDIADGNGIIVNSQTGETTNVFWEGLTGLAPTFLATDDVSFVAINSSGLVVQQNTFFTPEDYAGLIVIGALAHPDNLEITVFASAPNPAVNTGVGVNTLAHSLGTFNIEGNVFSENEDDLTLHATEGQQYQHGANWLINEMSPDISDLSEQSAPSFFMVTQAPGVFTVDSVIDPENYDVAGVVTPIIPAMRWQVQRIYQHATVGIFVQYGQELYNSIEDAKIGVFTEEFIPNDAIDNNTVLRAYLIIEKGTTDLTAAVLAGDAEFLEVEKFGRGFQSGSGGSGAPPSSTPTYFDTIKSTSTEPVVVFFVGDSNANSLFSNPVDASGQYPIVQNNNVYIWQTQNNVPYEPDDVQWRIATPNAAFMLDTEVTYIGMPQGAFGNAGWFAADIIQKRNPKRDVYLLQYASAGTNTDFWINGNFGELMLSDAIHGLAEALSQIPGFTGSTPDVVIHMNANNDSMTPGGVGGTPTVAPQLYVDNIFEMKSTHPYLDAPLWFHTSPSDPLQTLSTIFWPADWNGMELLDQQTNSNDRVVSALGLPTVDNVHWEFDSHGHIGTVVGHSASSGTDTKSLERTENNVQKYAPEIEADFDCHQNNIDNVSTIDLNGREYPVGVIVFADKPDSYIDLMDDENFTYGISGLFATGGNNVFQASAVLAYGGTKTLDFSMYFLSGGFLFDNRPTITNNVAFVGTFNFSGITTLNANTTYLADTLACTGSLAFFDYDSHPVFDTINGGTFDLSGAVITQYSARLELVTADVTDARRECYTITESGGDGFPESHRGFITNEIVKATDAADLFLGLDAGETGHFGIQQTHEKKHQWNGAHQWKVRHVDTANVTLDHTDHVLDYTSASGFFGPTLPLASTCEGREYVIRVKPSSAVSIVIKLSGADTINETAGAIFFPAGQVIRLTSDGGIDWMITG